MRPIAYPQPVNWWRWQPESMTHKVAEGRYSHGDLDILAIVRKTWCTSERFHIYRPAGML